jgi:hypothetical protein
MNYVAYRFMSFSSRGGFSSLALTTARRKRTVCYEMLGLVAVALVHDIEHTNVYDLCRLVWEHMLRILRRTVLGKESKK